MGFDLTLIEVLKKEKKINQKNMSNSTILNFQAGRCMFKVKVRNTRLRQEIRRTRCEICSKLKIKSPERPQWSRSGVFFVKFEHISHLILKFLLLTLSR